MCEGPMLRRTATLGDRGDRGENRGDEVGGGAGQGRSREHSSPAHCGEAFGLPCGSERLLKFLVEEERQI